MHRVQAFAFSLLVTVALTAASPAKAQDVQREWLRGVLESAYPLLAARLGFTIRPGTPEWEEASRHPSKPCSP